MNIRILIATHKQFDAPQDDLYLPIHVGREGKKDLGYTGDNIGDNISIQNPYYSELTALYWAWKNLDTDYIGLVHYRRFLSLKNKENILTKKEAFFLCRKCDIILPKKRYYIIETNISHYSHIHGSEYLNMTRKIIKETYPEYLKSFDKVMRKRSAHMFNMFIMKKKLADEYCKWLFDILFQLNEMIDFSNLSSFQERMPSRIGEHLLDIWIMKNKYSYKEINYVQIGSLNWPKKIKKFLLAKFIGKIYTESC
jgi:hypothetical protein